MVKENLDDDSLFPDSEPNMKFSEGNVVIAKYYEGFLPRKNNGQKRGTVTV